MRPHHGLYDVEVEVEEEPLPTLGAVHVGSTSAYSLTPTATKAPATSANALTAPVSGTVVTVLVEAGAEVKSGDTLGSIALKFNTTVKAIVAANAIADRRTIRTGQILVIP